MTAHLPERTRWVLFGRALCRARCRMGLTVRGMAVRCGLTERDVRALEGGLRRPALVAGIVGYVEASEWFTCAAALRDGAWSLVQPAALPAVSIGPAGSFETPQAARERVSREHPRRD